MILNIETSKQIKINWFFLWLVLAVCVCECVSVCICLESCRQKFSVMGTRHMWRISNLPEHRNTVSGHWAAFKIEQEAAVDDERRTNTNIPNQWPIYCGAVNVWGAEAAVYKFPRKKRVSSPYTPSLLTFSGGR